MHSDLEESLKGTLGSQ
jgi:hypothetical protein